jgi:phosphatidylglycerol---prolipoprotein diacylglyceryl transferase
MLPYFEQPVLHLGPVPVYAFGVMVAIGIAVGIWLATRRAPLYGIDREDLYDFIQWMLIPAFVISHVLDAAWYHPAELVEHPEMLLSIGGLSSFGGFLGAIVGALMFRARRKVEILPYVDLTLSVFPIAWVFGRAGCTLAHDHPGVFTDASNPLAFAYPDGPRWDLGFLEMLFSIVLSLAIVAWWRKPRPIGFYTAVTMIAYAPVRFALDFLREDPEHGGDARYAALTPGQWAALAMLAGGLYFAARARTAPPAGPAPTPEEPAVPQEG